MAAFPAEHGGGRSSAPPGFLESLAALDPGAYLSVRFLLDGPGVPPRATVGLDIDGEGERPAGADRRLDQILAVGFPGARFEAAGPGAGRARHWRAILPAGFDLSVRAAGTAPRPLRAANDDLADAETPLACDPTARRFDLAAALAVLAAAGPAELELRAAAFDLDARARRGVARLRERLAARSDRLRGDDGAGATLCALCAKLAAASRAARVEIRAGFASPPDDLTVDLLTLALFGARAAREEAGERVDLRGVWPLDANLPSLLPSAQAVARLAGSPASEPAEVAPGALVIGVNGADGPVVLTADDRARHLYVIGATGTGKSTLLLNLLAQDFAAGEGVILLDPHGDLADDALALVPAGRRADLIFADAADPDGAFALDILAGHGGDPALERNYVANGLIRLFTRVLYAGVPEAFGPMFELYFRNALLLLMEGGGANPSLLDFDAVFLDAAARARMLERCADAKVIEFWTGLVPGITHEDHTLNNIAPYVTCKLAQLTGNPLMRRVLCRGDAGLDLGAAMNAGRILILKAPKGLIGQSDAELLCALTCQSIVQAAMARAALPRRRRRPVRLYIDEFQTCAGEALADMLAEARKFGLSLVLANQSLGQVDGDRRRPDTGAAALANAANLIAFRVGAPDAARLGPWFAPDVEWSELCRLPDFHALACVLANGRPAPAAVVRMLPAPPASPWAETD